jgi:hypothetical protein
MKCLARYCGMHFSTDGILSLLSSSSTPQHFFSLSDPTSASFLLDRLVWRPSALSVLLPPDPDSRCYTHTTTDRSHWSFLFLLAPTLHTTEHTLSSMLNTHHHNSGSLVFLFFSFPSWLLVSNITEHTLPHSHVQDAPLFDAHTHHHHHNSGQLDTCFFVYCFCSPVNVAVGFWRSPIYSAWLADLCKSWVAGILG